ncbi:MAG TPA: SdrD B-like domain-containing protein [Tepidisphaeraceae bacterium]|nr:SdrD B-like domain-containing protein [Tepidisphaeraceae bacterium]
MSETVLTPANVNPTDFGKQFNTPVDGQVFAQPLYVQNVNITRGANAGVHSVVYVATMHDSLYAIDASTGTILWQDSFLNTANPTNLTATSGVTPVAIADLGNVAPASELGILSTPAIDVNRGRLFLNAETKEIRGADKHFVQRLWAVNLSDGSAAVSPAVIGDTISNNDYYSYGGYTYVAGPIVAGSGDNPDPTTYPNKEGWLAAPGGATTPVMAYNALIQMNRGSLTLLKGNVYLGMASDGDEGPYHGWLLGYDESSLALTAAFVTTPTYEDLPNDRPGFPGQGGIWSSGSAIATDGTYLYVAAGNGAFNTDPSNFDAQGFPIDHDYADSLLKLAVDNNSSPTNQNGNGWGLKVADYFTPSNAAALDAGDMDLGSGGVLLLPDSLTDAAGNPMLVVGGKEGRLYLLDRNNLGKFNTSYPDTGEADPRLYDHALGEYAGSGIDHNTAQILSTASYFQGNFYIGVEKLPALEFNVSTFASGSIPPGTVSPTPVQQTANFSYPGPTFTISANGASNGIAWAMDTTASDLIAYDAADITTPIYTSDMVQADSYSHGVKFTVPTVANGMVYLGNGTSSLVGYGLRSSYLSSDPDFFSAPTGLSVSPVNSGDNHLIWTSHSSLATEFRIDRSTDNSTWTTLAYVSNSETSYDDTAVAADTQYDYRIVAISGASTTLSQPPPPPPPPPPQTGSIAGEVFNDANGNATLDSNEAGLKTIKVYIDANDNGVLDTSEVSTPTDTTGHYLFSNLPAKNYVIREALPSGWKQTMPANNAAITVSLSAGQSAAGKNFGEQLISASGSISGTIYNDANGNGSLNSGEGGRGGIVVYNDANNDTKLDNGERSTTTLATGAYVLPGLTAATYHIREVLPSGWKQTTPASNAAITIALSSAQVVSGENFGEQLISASGSISGTVFNDANGNGSLNTGEGGRSGIVVYNDANNDSKLDNNESSTTTPASGAYVLPGLTAGTYRIREVIASGWKQTTPASNAAITISLASAQVVTGKNIGEQQIPTAGTISGNVFNDANGNQKKDSTEVGLSGWTVYIDVNNDSKLDDGEKPILTDKNGNYSMTGILAGTYIVRANRPTGWSQTTPTKNLGQHVVVMAGKSATGVLFGEKKTA